MLIFISLVVRSPTMLFLRENLHFEKDGDRLNCGS